MKKLTAGIFAGILTIVTVNAADAAITSKAYVDDIVGKNATAITALTETVAENKTAADAAIAELNDEANGAVATAKKYTDDQIGTLSDGKGGTYDDVAAAIAGAIEKASGEAGEVATDMGDLAELDTTEKSSIVDAINEVKGEADTNKAAIETLNGDKTEEGSVEYKIAQSESVINTELAKKANMLKNPTNALITTDGINGDITALTISENSTDGEYVMTMKKDGSNFVYGWELVQRKETTPAAGGAAGGEPSSN